MARNLVTNPDFYLDLTGWTVQNVTVIGFWAHTHYLTGRCAKLDSTVTDAWLEQNITIPGNAGQNYRVRFVVRAYNGKDAETPIYLQLDVEDPTLPIQPDLYARFHPVDYDGEWHTIGADCGAKGGDVVTIRITLDTQYATNQCFVDDIEFFVLDPAELSAEGLARELMRRRGDMGGFLHDPARYRDVVNEAILQAPRALWRLAVDASVSTLEDGDPVRRYSLAGVDDLDTADQVRRVWMEGSDEHNYQLGRWWVEDDEGTLTLVLDDDPPTTGRELRVEFLAPHPVLDVIDWDDATELDREWLLARGMTILLMEADLTVEDAGKVEADLRRWDLMRQGREVEMRGRRRRGSGKARTLNW